MRGNNSNNKPYHNKKCNNRRPNYHSSAFKSKTYENLQITVTTKRIPPGSSQGNLEPVTKNLKLEVNIEGRSFNAIIDFNRNATMINRAIIKLLKPPKPIANYEVISIPMIIGSENIEVQCVTNYMLKVPVILGKQAIELSGYELKPIESTPSVSNLETGEDGMEDILDLEIQQDDEQFISNNTRT